MLRWIGLVLALMIVGCSAIPSVPARPAGEGYSQARGPAVRPAARIFSAKFAGHYSLYGCSPPDGQGRFMFDGAGSGTFIHNATENGSMGGFVYQGCPWNGSAMMLSTSNPLNKIAMKLTLAKGFIHQNTPCNPGVRGQIMYAISGGAGRFANATGSGTVVFACTGGISGTYTDQWSGTIVF